MSEKEFVYSGSEYITERIAEAVENGTRTAVITGNYRVERAILIPSNFTLILKNCHLRMADGIFDNMFVNEHHGTDIGRTSPGTDRNISIVGEGEAILDGGEYNGLSERNSGKDGMPPIWKNNLILFTNVDGFKISGIACHNQRWWAMNFLYCSNGYIGNIDFCACDIGVDADGNRYRGLVRERYDEVLVKNADGIDLRQGCHHIVIENITGFTEDDTVALTGLNGRVEKAFSVDGLSSDIAFVEIRNIVSAAFCTNVRLLNQGDVKLHDIVIDGVYDVARESSHADHGLYAVRIGDTRLYGTRHATSDETYNISVRNVRGAGDYVISLAGAMSNFSMYGIESAYGAKMLLDNRTE